MIYKALNNLFLSDLDLLRIDRLHEFQILLVQLFFLGYDSLHGLKMRT